VRELFKLESGRKLAALAAIWTALVLAPFWMPLLGGYTALGTRVLVLGLAAMSVNFLLGFTGVLSFGHAAWFGIGAYGCGMILKFIALSTPLGILAGTLAGGLAGAVLGALMRPFYRQPLHLGVITLDILNNAVAFYYFVLFCFALAVAAMAFTLRSPFGRTMLAIRENERRARFLGIPVELHIWIAFTLSCFFMAYAGSLYALVNNFADPRGLHYSQSGDFVMMAVMGGMRSFWGPLLGAIVFVVFQDYVSSVTINWQIFIGLLFVLVVLFFPRGILGAIRLRVAP